MPEAEAPRRWKTGLWWRTSPAPLRSPGTALTCTPRAGPWRPGSQAPGVCGGGRLAHPRFSSTLLPPVSLPHLPLGAPRINNQIKCCTQILVSRSSAGGTQTGQHICPEKKTNAEALSASPRKQNCSVVFISIHGISTGPRTPSHFLQKTVKLRITNCLHHVLL